MSNKIVKIAAYAFLIGSFLITGQPAHAQVAETLSHIKDKACSSTGAAVGLGLWCCGVTYWCLKLQKNQRKLQEQMRGIDPQGLKQQIEIEKKKRRSLKEELGHVNELLQSHSNVLLEYEKNFKNRVEPLELAMYGVGADDTKKAFRLSVLSKFMEAQSSVTVKACGRIDAFDSNESFGDSGQGSLDSSLPLGEGLCSPASREGSVSPILQEKQVKNLENKPSSCSLM